MAQEEIPAELQQDIQKLQQMSGQLQAVQQQAQQFEMMKHETERALEAVGALEGDGPVYRNVGSLMVQETPAAAKERLQDDLETLEIRVKRTKDQEQQMTQELQQLQQKLQAAFQGSS